MAKQLIPEELDALIKEYLTDGVLTDKERQVILKKAVGMGLDRDEIDLYLDAQVQKIDQATDAAARKQTSGPSHLPQPGFEIGVAGFCDSPELRVWIHSPRAASKLSSIRFLLTAFWTVLSSGNCRKRSGLRCWSP